MVPLVLIRHGLACDMNWHGLTHSKLQTLKTKHECLLLTYWWGHNREGPTVRKVRLQLPISCNQLKGCRVVSSHVSVLVCCSRVEDPNVRDPEAEGLRMESIYT